MLSVIEKPSDKRIGCNVALFREHEAGLSQKELADEMRHRGHRWAQATVWAVEKGERPLRFTEAQDLCLILGVDLPDLAMTPGNVALRSAVERATRAGRDLAVAVSAFVSMQYVVRDLLEEAGEEADPTIKEEAEEVAALTLDEAVKLGNEVAEWRRSGSEGDAPQPGGVLGLWGLGRGTGRLVPVGDGVGLETLLEDEAMEGGGETRGKHYKAT